MPSEPIRGRSRQDKVISPIRCEDDVLIVGRLAGESFAHASVGADLFRHRVRAHVIAGHLLRLEGIKEKEIIPDPSETLLTASARPYFSWISLSGIASIAS